MLRALCDDALRTASTHSRPVDGRQRELATSSAEAHSREWAVVVFGAVIGKPSSRKPSGPITPMSAVVDNIGAGDLAQASMVGAWAVCSFRQSRAAIPPECSRRHRGGFVGTIHRGGFVGTIHRGGLSEQSIAAACRNDPSRRLCRNDPSRRLCRNDPSRRLCRNDPSRRLCRNDPSRRLRPNDLHAPGGRDAARDAGRLSAPHWNVPIAPQALVADRASPIGARSRLEAANWYATRVT